MPTKIKPTVFIGSSTENLPSAATLQDALDYETESFVWHQDGFPPSTYPLEALEKHLDDVDFAIFLFAPDDVTVTRGATRSTVRDNVLFELGLFIGRLSRSRTFIVKPRGVQLDLPSDLFGVTPIEYEPLRSDANHLASLGPASRKILEIIRSHGPRSRPIEAGSVNLEGRVSEKTLKKSASNYDPFVFNNSSKQQDYTFGYLLATAEQNPSQQQQVDQAFLKSPLNDTAEALAIWEAWKTYTRMSYGESAMLQPIRDQVAKFPDCAQLHRILGDALEHYGDMEGAFKSYSKALETAETVEIAASVIIRLSGWASRTKVALSYASLRSQLLALLRPGYVELDVSLSLAMRSLAVSADLMQIAQSIDEIRISQTPDDSELKFNLAHSLAQDDADLAMVYYEDIPSIERSATAWNNLGVAYSNLQIPGSAVSAYEAASGKGETIADGNLANLLMEAGFFEMARAKVQKAITVKGHHNNVVVALNAIEEAEAEEREKHTTARAAGECKRDFLRQLGRAALRSGSADIVGLWETPEGILEVSSGPNGSFLVSGEFVRGQSMLGLGSLFTRTPASAIDKTIVKGHFKRFGDAFEGTIMRKPDGPAGFGLLSSFERKEVVVLYLQDSLTLRVSAKTFERQETKWTRIVSPSNTATDV